jgi:hypothetical protein
MAQTASQRNPFMLMMHPEIVLAAIEKSEHLGQLNRHLCRPLDRIPGAAAEGQVDALVDEGEGEAFEPQ